MPVVWNADNDARLLMAYIEATDAKLGTDGWKTIADKLGGDTTVGAISQRFTKVLKKKYGGANCALGSGGDGGGKASAPATPAKSSRSRKKKGADDPEKTPRSSPRKRGAKDDVAEGEGDDEVPDSPTKKIRSESYFDQGGEDV